ncbi:hypothetical protein C7E25_24450, partial [Stenotrophomonas maltophilia]
KWTTANELLGTRPVSVHLHSDGPVQLHAPPRVLFDVNDIVRYEVDNCQRTAGYAPGVGAPAQRWPGAAACAAAGA